MFLKKPALIVEYESVDVSARVRFIKKGRPADKCIGRLMELKETTISVLGVSIFIARESGASSSVLEAVDGEK